MSEATSRYPGVELSGPNLSTIAEAFGLFPKVGMSQLVRHGLAHSDSTGNTRIDVDRWYPLDDVLAALDDVLVAVGPVTMFEIGRQIPRNTHFPPNIADPFAALASANIAYHMNHRKDGRPMFEPSTGATRSGIGGFRIVSPPGSKPVLIESDNAYPCALRHGLLTALATRFVPRAAVSHPPDRCRLRGAPVCTYEASW